MDIYIDNASTTKPKSWVIESIKPYLDEKWYNPSSLYNNGKLVKKDIEGAKEIVAKYINSQPDEIYFTSGGSESNCWVIQGFIKEHKNENVTIITSTIEHKSIIDCLFDYAEDVNINFISVDKKGFINMDELENCLKVAFSKGCKTLVTIQYANNEIGTIQPIYKISELVHRYGGVFHTDAVQAFGQIDINVSLADIDIMSVSGHKIGCPKGIGFLYKKNDINIKPIIYGSQMNGLRGGTENVPYIIVLSKAIEALYNTKISNIEMYAKRNYMVKKIKNKLDCHINGDTLKVLPNNISITFHQNITGEALIYLLDTCNIFISSGSACDLGKPSHVLKAIGLSDDEISKTIRISLSNEIDILKINYIINELEKCIKILCDI